MYHVMRGMTRTSQQVRRGVLEKKAEQWGFVLLVLFFFRTTMDEKFIGIFIKQYHKLWSVRTGGFYGGI